jgi:hypothetical protein
MPCYDGGYGDHSDPRVPGLERTINELKRDLNDLRTTDDAMALEAMKEILERTEKRLHEVTELLCEATFIIYRNGFLDPETCSIELLEWNDEHIKEDVERLKKEFKNLVTGKGATVKQITTWYNKLSDKEQWCIDEFKILDRIKLVKL